jgi:hypothetical protein
MGAYLVKIVMNRGALAASLAAIIVITVFLIGAASVAAIVFLSATAFSVSLALYAGLISGAAIASGIFTVLRLLHGTAAFFLIIIIIAVLSAAFLFGIYFLVAILFHLTSQTNLSYNFS